MTANPGGMRITRTEVKWSNNQILKISLTSTAAYKGCPAGYFCISFATNDDQSLGWVWQEPGKAVLGRAAWIALGRCPYGPTCGASIRSYANDTGFRAWLEQHRGHGNELCITKDTWHSSYDGPDRRDFWLYASGNPAKCPALPQARAGSLKTLSA